MRLVPPLHCSLTLGISALGISFRYKQSDRSFGTILFTPTRNAIFELTLDSFWLCIARTCLPMFVQCLMSIQSLIYSHLSDTVFRRFSTLPQSHYTHDGVQLVPPIASPSTPSCRNPFIWSSSIRSRRFVVYTGLELPPGIKANDEHFGTSCRSSNRPIGNFSLISIAADIMKFTQRAFDANVTLISSDASDGAMITQAGQCGTY